LNLNWFSFSFLSILFDSIQFNYFLLAAILLCGLFVNNLRVLIGPVNISLLELLWAMQMHTHSQVLYSFFFFLFFFFLFFFFLSFFLSSSFFLFLSLLLVLLNLLSYPSPSDSVTAVWSNRLALWNASWYARNHPRTVPGTLRGGQGLPVPQTIPNHPHFHDSWSVILLLSPNLFFFFELWKEALIIASVLVNLTVVRRESLSRFSQQNSHTSSCHCETRNMRVWFLSSPRRRPT